MNRKTRCLISACLFLTAYASTGMVQADTSNNYKSPEAAPAGEILHMPTTVEEMAKRMSAMKSRGLRNDPCVAGVKAIRRQHYNLEQAKRYWEGCAHNYKTRMTQQRINGGKL